MKVYSSNEIRNVAIIGHSGCGKTTVSEAALFASGVTSRMGKIVDGNTVSDYDPEEARRQVSISGSVIPIEWKDTKINFIDTPGYFDFVGEVKQALRVADLALIVVSAKSGVEVGAEKAWEYANELGIAKMIFINGMDDENADFDKVVEEMKEKFGTSVAPLQVPFKESGKFNGFVNANRKEAFKFAGGNKTEACPIPDGMDGDVENIRRMLEEAVAETDDDLMNKFFEEEPFTVEEISSGVRKGVVDGTVTPVFCGAAALNIGVGAVLNAIVSYLPPAGDVCAKVTAKNIKSGEEVTIECDEKAPLSALVFRTIVDPFVGRLSLFRIYSGVMKRETPLYNSDKDASERVGHMYVLRGKEQIEVDELKAGDIGALAKLTSTGTNDTLCIKENAVELPKIEFPKPFYAMGVIPKGKGDEDKIAQAILKCVEEDRTLTFAINPETHQAVLTGIGDNQLDVILNKLKTKYKVEAELIDAIVPYREVIKGKCTADGIHKKQSGGHGQYGVVKIDFEPSGDLTSAYVFEEKVFGGSVPKNFFPSVEKGIADCVKAGPLAAYPVVGLKATLIDGKYHPVDSSDMAFQVATRNAFRDGFLKAKPALLEPVAKVEVFVPDSYTGDIMGDMNKRRGRINGMNKQGNKQVISAEAPMAELFKYQLDLRSMTQGRGEFTMEFLRYDEAPNDVSQKVIESRKKELEESRKE